VHTAHKGVHQECPPQVTGEAEPLGPIGHLAHKATLSIQESSQNVETKNRSQMKEMEESKQLYIEFKTTVRRFFKNFLEKANKFSETLENMKKDQLEIKHTLTEIKNNIQRSNSRLEDCKNQVKNLKYKEAKNTARKAKRKKNPKI
jgi:chromosome segregation ATPase